MSPEDRKTLDEIKNIAEDCRDILHRIQRARRLEMAWRIFYWIIILGLAFGSYYFIQPYIDRLLSAYGTIQNQINEVGRLNDTVKSIDITSLLKR
jgi:hypothetical protein